MAECLDRLVVEREDGNLFATVMINGFDKQRVGLVVVAATLNTVESGRRRDIVGAKCAARWVGIRMGVWIHGLWDND